MSVGRRGTKVNFQWTGSNTNPNGNEGQGRAGSDRSNMVQINSRVLNVPRFYSSSDSDRLFQSREEATRYATVSSCTGNGPCNIQETLDDSPAYFTGGLKQFNEEKTYYYMSTRNNNFSNRSEKVPRPLPPSPPHFFFFDHCVQQASKLEEKKKASPHLTLVFLLRRARSPSPAAGATLRSRRCKTPSTSLFLSFPQTL